MGNPPVSKDWPRVPWALVHPGDQVYAADRHVWDVVSRDGKMVAIERTDGEKTRRMAAVDPPGDVPCWRGEQWRAVVEAVGVMRAAGFTVDLLGTWTLHDST